MESFKALLHKCYYEKSLIKPLKKMLRRFISELNFQNVSMTIDSFHGTGAVFCFVKVFSVCLNLRQQSLKKTKIPKFHFRLFS